MPVQKLKEFLDGEHVKYVIVSHSTAYTAQEIAALTHTRGKDMAKTVMVKLDNELAMAVLPASRRIDLARLKGATGSNQAALATEAEFKGKFPGCETGAMPPFGNLWGVRVFVEESLTRDQEIAFNAGSHNELAKLAYADFERVVRPIVLRFAMELPREKSA